MFKKLYEDMDRLRKKLADLFPNGLFIRYKEYDGGAYITVRNFGNKNIYFGEKVFKIEWVDRKAEENKKQEWIHYEITRLPPQTAR